MFAYTIRRLAGMLPTLLILVTATFFLMRLAPGGPFDSDQAWPPEIKANIAHRYELDLPITQQYLHWLRDLVRGDLRDSFQYLGHPVTEIISQGLPISIWIGTLALIISILIGIPLGCYSSFRAGSWIDRSILFMAVSGLSLPSYLLASVLILVFAMKLDWFPPALWEGPSSWVLPALALGWRPTAIVIRLTRASMLEVLSSDYIRTAYGKGLAPRAVILKHALKNSLIPVVTVMGPIAASLITGSFIIEVVFQIPGLGKHFVQAVLNRDYPLVMGVTLTYGIILILSNLAVDLFYAWADPRIRAFGLGDSGGKA